MSDENLGQGPRSQVDAEVSTPLSAEKVKAAAKAGLAAAATKAKVFADHEEREIQRLSANIINHQVLLLLFFFFWEKVQRLLLHLSLIKSLL